MNNVLVPSTVGVATGSVLKKTVVGNPGDYNWADPDVIGGGQAGQVAVWDAHNSITGLNTSAGRMQHNAAQLYSYSTTYNTVQVNGCHSWTSTTTCNSGTNRLTVTRAGIYEVSSTFVIYGAQTSAINVFFRWYKNASTAIGQEVWHLFNTVETSSTLTISDVFELSNNDTIELKTKTPNTSTDGYYLENVNITIKRIY
jgi:hypothetical protein